MADATTTEGSLGVADNKDATPWNLKDFLLYFLRLGSLGFGGPIALAGYMQRDLVEKRGWITREDYVEGLALAQLAPGPLAAQLAMYLGWVRAGVLGATLVSFAFILPSFLMVMAISAVYVRYGGLPWMQGMFYGVGAAVIAIIGQSAWKLVKMTMGKDRALFAIMAVSAIATIWTQSEVVWLFLASGIVNLALKSPPPASSRPAAIVLPAWLLTGVLGQAPLAVLSKIFLYFALAGAVVFGSGLAIVPFLHGGVVNQYHWLNERQFLDAVAVAMITPGPVVITVAFIGYLVAGPLGAVAAAFGVFVPCYFFVIIPARYFRKAAQNPRVKAFVNGVTAAATGAIVGAVIVLGRRALVDIPTVLIAVVTMAVILKVKKVPEPAIIVVAGIIGMLLKL